MSDPLDWNAQTIAEFRANDGKVGGVFEGAPIVLLHHRGRKSGREYGSPVMYLPHDTEPDTIYVFATRGGAPVNPDWYNNLVAAGDASVELACRRRAHRVSPRRQFGGPAVASVPRRDGDHPRASAAPGYAPALGVATSFSPRPRSNAGSGPPRSWSAARPCGTGACTRRRCSPRRPALVLKGNRWRLRYLHGADRTRGSS